MTPENTKTLKKENVKENKMGIMPVKKLVITMSLPMMFSMLVQALYNIVDSIFVSRISERALSAVTLAYPMQNLMIAVATGTAVGINALLSKSLGEKNFDKANDTANNGILTTILSYLLFVLIGIFLVPVFISSQTSDKIIVDYGISYTKVCCFGSLALFCQVTFERLLQSTGRTVFSMISQITGAVINIIFDPILIFGLLGFPKLGVTGAAIATVFGQLCASLTALFLNVKYNKDIKIGLKRVFNINDEVIKKIYSVGIPSILMVSIGSIMTYFMNRILGTFSSTATAVFGVYFKLQSFFFMPVFGLNNGIIPVLAYNLGAKRKDRIKETLKFALLLAFIMMLTGTLCFELLPDKLLTLFNAGEKMIKIGVPAMRIIALHFPIAAVSIILISTFQAFSKSMYSLVVSVCRQLVVLIPVAYFLAKTGVLNNVWWCFVCAEVMSVSVSIFFFKKIYKEFIK